MMDRWLRRLYFCAGVSETRQGHVTHVALIPGYRVRQLNGSPRQVERYSDCGEIEFSAQGFTCSQHYVLHASF